MLVVASVVEHRRTRLTEVQRTRIAALCARIRRTRPGGLYRLQIQPRVGFRVTSSLKAAETYGRPAEAPAAAPGRE